MADAPHNPINKEKKFNDAFSKKKKKNFLNYYVTLKDGILCFPETVVPSGQRSFSFSVA